jgi:hypothetical protein
VSQIGTVSFCYVNRHSYSFHDENRLGGRFTRIEQHTKADLPVSWRLAQSREARKKLRVASLRSKRSVQSQVPEAHGSDPFWSRH